MCCLIFIRKDVSRSLIDSSATLHDVRCIWFRDGNCINWWYTHGRTQQTINHNRRFSWVLLSMPIHEIMQSANLPSGQKINDLSGNHWPLIRFRSIKFRLEQRLRCYACIKKRQYSFCRYLNLANLSKIMDNYNNFIIRSFKRISQMAMGLHTNSMMNKRWQRMFITGHSRRPQSILLLARTRVHSNVLRPYEFYIHSANSGMKPCKCPFCCCFFFCLCCHH